MAKTKTTPQSYFDTEKCRKKYKFPMQGLKSITAEQRKATNCILKLAMAWYVLHIQIKNFT